MGVKSFVVMVKAKCLKKRIEVLKSLIEEQLCDSEEADFVKKHL